MKGVERQGCIQVDDSNLVTIGTLDGRVGLVLQGRSGALMSPSNARELSQMLWNAADALEQVTGPDDHPIADRVPHHLWGRDPALVEAVVRQLDRCAQDGFVFHAMEALAARILDLVAMECDPNSVQLTADDSLVSWWPYIDAASGALLEVALCSPDDSLQQLCAEVRDWVGHVKRRGRIPTTWAWPDRAIRSRIVEI